MNQVVEALGAEGTSASQQIAIGMITAPRVIRTLDASVESFRGGRFHQHLHLFSEPGTLPAEWKSPSVVVHRNSVRLGCVGNWLQAAKWLVQHTPASHLMICEDDSLFCFGASDALDYGLAHLDQIGCLSLYTPVANYAFGQHTETGWFPLRSPAKWGTLAICMPCEVLCEFLKVAPTRAREGTDRYLAAFLQDRGLHWYCHAPSLVEHIGATSTIGHRHGPGNAGVGFQKDFRPIYRRGGAVALTPEPPIHVDDPSAADVLPGVESAAELAVQAPGHGSLSVVIPCHNYGKFLGECLESVLDQGLRGGEILVVDDASTDNTAEVASRYHSRGVQYLRVNNKNIHATRGDGFRATCGKFVCFLDADDRLGAGYLPSALRIFEKDENWNIGIVHSDIERFGHESGRWTYPEIADPGQIEQANCMHAGSVVRRQAVELSRVFDRPVSSAVFEDWWMWRQLLRFGWKAKKSDAIYHYRRHAGGSRLEQAKRGTFFESTNLAAETVTILTMLGGGKREWAWGHLSAFLRRQSWPHSQIRLVIGDTSGDDRFSRSIRSWIADSDYPDVRHIRMSISRPGLADENRFKPSVGTEVNLAVSRGWSALTRQIDTPWTWIIEDDTLPPDDALERLMKAVHHDVDAVTGAYRSRHHSSKHWLVFRPFDRKPTLRDELKDVLIGEEPRGVNQVSGSGFGCLLVRSHHLRNHVFGSHGKSQWYDPSFFQANNLKTLCDWSVVCRHYVSEDRYV